MGYPDKISNTKTLERPVNGAVQYAIELISVSKSFRRQTRSKNGYTTLKSSLLKYFFSGGGSSSNYTEVLHNLTLRIPKGSSVGIIGRNGAGKSTFLKLITGIYKPASGTIKLNGRVAALIELGAGFHPEFTGRENLVLGGVLHGLTKSEIEDRLDQIIEFAELRDVIDDPVRTYSTGMFMRLGFSLAIHTDPDILLVDEVLAVGDASFVAKCKEKIDQFRRSGKTLIFVTHDLAAVERWCDEVLWLNEGRVEERGDPRRVIDAYLQYIEHEEEHALERIEFAASEDKVQDSGESRWGGREVEIIAAKLTDKSGVEHKIFHPEDSCKIEFEYKMNEVVNDLVFGVAINIQNGAVLHGTNTDIERVKVPINKRSGKVTFLIERLGLLEGSYEIDLAAHKQDGYPFDYRKGILSFKVRSPLKQVGVFDPKHRWEFQ